MTQFVADYTGMASEDEQERVTWALHLFNQVRIRRVVFEGQWEETVAIAWPEHRSVFTYLHERAPGQKHTQYQIDAHGSIASHRFGAICDSMMTPGDRVWIRARAKDRNLRKARRVKLFQDELTHRMHCARYEPDANFVGQNQVNWQSLGVLGNMNMYLREFYAPHMPKKKGISYQSCHVGEIYYLTNFQGRVDGYFRYFRRNARQSQQMWPDKLPPMIRSALESGSQQLWDFLEFVHPRTDWRPWEILTPKGKPYASTYISVQGHCILEESGYRSFPLPNGRYMVAPEEDYGRGPGQMVLPSLKTKNAVKGDYLRAGHQQARPSYLIGDDGLFDFKTHPNSFNYTQFVDGKPQVAVLPTGKFEVSEAMLQEEGKYIDDAFLVSLFQLLFNDLKNGNAQKSAREVIEYAAERGIFLAPTVGSQGLYLCDMGRRELDILSSQNMLPDLPPELKEAGGIEGAVELVPCGPLAMAAKAQEAAGSLQTLEAANQVANFAPDVYDIFEMDEIFRDVGESRGMPERHFASLEKMQQRAQARQQSQEREARAKEMPAQAAIIKAQAIMAKGDNRGVLSGTPQGGMPQIPGNPPGQPGQPPLQPGQPGQPGMPAR